MKVLKLFFVSLFLTTTVYASYAPDNIVDKKPEQKLSAEYGTEYSKEELLPIVQKYSFIHNVSAEKMMYTLEAESHFKNVQSSCHKNTETNCGTYGVREESYGIAQFHVSTLSRESALNPYTAIENMAIFFSKGEACRWTEYKKKYGCE